jgi:ketosteroid isomerase-like protein
MNATTESVMNHHLKAFAENDVSEIMEDYTEDAELWTPEGKVVGLAAITAFFTEAFKLVPSGQTQFNLSQSIITGDTVFIVWNADSPVASIPLGTDTFIFREGKIVLQTLAAIINLKQSS